MIIKVLFLMVAIPAVAIGLIRLARRLLRWGKQNPTEAAFGLSETLLPASVGDAVDGWLSDSASSSPAEHSDAGADHHHDFSDHH